MPQVKIENTKGLYQQTGTGFEFVDEQAKPAIETCSYSVVNIACVADVDDSLDGKYFDISSSQAHFRVWFDVDDSGTSAPSAIDSSGRTRTLVEITGVTTGMSAVNVAAEIEDDLTTIGGMVSDDAAADGNIMFQMYGAPGALLAAPDAGTSGFTLTSSDGAGQLALTPKKRVSIIEAPTALGGNTTTVPTSSYTLAGGSWVGQEKLIVRNDVINVDLTVEIATINIDDSSGIDATATAVFPADTSTADGEDASARVLDLIWIGDRWLQRGQNTVGAATGANKTITGILGS